MTAITDLDNQFFSENGFLIKEGILNEATSAKICLSLEEKGSGNFGMEETIRLRNIFDVICNDEIHSVLASLFNSKEYSLHHIHSALHTKQTPSLSWHHDKVTEYSKRKEGLMVHALIYPSGMSNEIGEVLLLAGSHKWKVDRYQLSKVPFNAFNKKEIGTLEKGSILFINSSLMHARRSLSANSEKSKRHFIDMSFCDSSLSWEPYLESSKDWRKLFSIIERSAEFQSRSYNGIINPDPYKHSLIVNLLPTKLQTKVYLLKSYYYRKILRNKISKIEI